MGNTLIKVLPVGWNMHIEDCFTNEDVETEAEVFRRILSSLGISNSLEEIKMAIMNAKQEAKDLGLLSLFGKLKSEEYWRRWDSLVLKHLNIENDEIAKLIQKKWFDYLECSLFPDVEGVLLRLKQMGLKIGLVTTAYEKEISIILGKSNLETDIFDVIVGADTVKKVKPDPDVFRYALKKLKVEAEESLFVGDLLDADYEGAENVGMKAILIDRTESKGKSSPRTITSLEEIFKHI